MAEFLPKLFGNMRRIRREYNKQRLKNCALVTFKFGKLIYTDHKIAHRSIERKTIYIFRNFFNGFMKGLKFGLSRSLFRDNNLPRRFRDTPSRGGHKQPPQFLQKTMHSRN